MSPGYVKTWNTCWFLYGAHWATHVERPRFALLPADTTVFLSLDSEVGRSLARNDSAQKLLALWCEECRRTGCAAPSYAMLRDFCEKAELDVDILPVDDFTALRNVAARGHG